MRFMNLKNSLALSIFSAIGASVCCVGPLVLLLLGIGGAWIGNLQLFEPYRPFLIALSIVFLGIAFRRLYLTPQVCAANTACANPLVLMRQRLIFWIIAASLLCLLALPLAAPLLM